MKKPDSGRICRKALACILLICIAAASGICFAEDVPDYYRIGLDVTATLNEMLQDRNYLEIFYTGDSVLNLLQTELNTGDYDSPTAVYRLKQKEPQEWIFQIIPGSELEKLNALSPALQEQLWNRMRGASYIANIINSKKGTDILALSAVFKVLLNKPELDIEQTEYFLFVFEKGLPVLVTYSHHYASGMILALEHTETESADALLAVFQPYGFEVTPYNPNP